MSLKLYYDLLSPPARAVYVFMSHCKIPFEPKLVVLAKKKQFEDGYEKISPFNKVPAIDDKGFTLTER